MSSFGLWPWNYLRARGEYHIPGAGDTGPWELPPRTRRIRKILHTKMAIHGTTSAHAENTRTAATCLPNPRNYLRARGEYYRITKRYMRSRELPPRTRRIRGVFLTERMLHGTTSAHAENTGEVPTPQPAPGNYLRARGEYTTRLWDLPASVELPPRTRRIQRRGDSAHQALGTTSAHAENTAHGAYQGLSKGNYLRARGEYSRPPKQFRPRKELPPRTRRILEGKNVTRPDSGTTSAHAENTAYQACYQPRHGNYLRARGEYGNGLFIQAFLKELPPRTRRIPSWFSTSVNKSGTTSAHAENTRLARHRPVGWWNYLRARGEYCRQRPRSWPAPELPPRTRRIPAPPLSGTHQPGTTSAHAENTHQHFAEG